MATEPQKKREWWEYLNQITDVITGKTVPTYELSFDTSTIIKMAVGLFGAIALAMLLNQVFIRLFNPKT